MKMKGTATGKPSPLIYVRSCRSIVRALLVGALLVKSLIRGNRAGFRLRLRCLSLRPR